MGLVGPVHWPTPASAQAPRPDGKIIAEVLTRGNRPDGGTLVPPERILSVMRSRPGTTYSRQTIEEDLQRLRDLRLFSDIRIDYQITPDDRVRLSVAVAELAGIVQDVQYRNVGHISRDELEKLSGIKVGSPMNPTANKLAAQAILKHLQENGRLWATVELLEGDKFSDSRVIFNISEGPAVKIANLRFTGNSFVSSERLRTQISSSRTLAGIIGGDYSPQLLEFDRQRLEEYYRALGFQDVQVNRTIDGWSEDKRWVWITFHIHEGPRYVVKKVQVEGNKSFSEDKLLSFAKLREGDVYDDSVITTDLNQIKDFYGYHGQAVAIRKQVFKAGPGEVTITYQITEQQPAVVGQVIIQGNEVTRDNVIRRQIPLYPGQILTYPDLVVGAANLARLGIFEVNPEAGIRPTLTVLDPDGDSNVKDILVNVQETSTGSFMIGLGVNSDAGLSGSIVLNERNFDLFRPPTSIEDILNGRAFRGAGQEFRLEAVPGTVFQRYSATFREPYLFDSNWGLGLSGYYFTRGYVEYTENRAGGRINLDRRFQDSPWRVSFSTRIEEVRIRDVSVFAPPDVVQTLGSNFLLGFRAGVSRDTRDSFIRPTSGSSFDATFEQVLGAYDFPLGIVEMSNYFTTYQRADGSGKHVLSIRNQVGFAGSNTPMYERFYAGGFRSLRGFEFRGVGPIVNGFNPGGDFSLLNSVEYQVPILANDKVFFVTFLDTGTVEPDVRIRDYRVTAGVGLRLAVPALGPVPIALDFGFPIVRGSGDREQIFAFFLGFAN
jgi:outer membrane protein insertion porin family